MAKDERKVFYTPVFRVSYPHVFVPQGNKDKPEATPKFSLSAIWDTKDFTPKDKELWKKISTEVNAACIKEHGKSFKECIKNSNFKRGIRIGTDEKEKDDVNYYFEGCRFASLTSSAKPGIVKRDGESPIESQEDFYAGCYARATITIYAYNNVSKGVALGLNNLQFIKHGEKISMRSTASDDFADAEEPDFEEDGGSDVNDIL